MLNSSGQATATRVCRLGLAGVTVWVQTGKVKRSIDLDDDLAAEIDRTATLVRETPATVIRLALRAGLPSVTNRYQAPRPEGYFADAYKDGARARFEDRIAKVTIQRPER